MEVNRFTHTSLDPYDKHYYELLLCNGNKIVFEYYEDLMMFWRDNYVKPNYLNYVVVKDRVAKNKENQKSKGFAK